MNQNKNKPLTADETLKKWCEYTYPSLPDAAKMALQTACHSYAAQQAKTAEENATWAHDQLQSMQEELIYYKDRCKKQGEQLKQVTEERDKAVKLISDADRILNESGYMIHPGSPLAQWINDFLNSLNAAKEGGE